MPRDHEVVPVRVLAVAGGEAVHCCVERSILGTNDNLLSLNILSVTEIQFCQRRNHFR